MFWAYLSLFIISRLPCHSSNHSMFVVGTFFIVRTLTVFYFVRILPKNKFQGYFSGVKIAVFTSYIVA